MALSKKGKASAEARMILSEKSSFLMQEDYRTLRSNIIFSFADAGPKVIAVTSAGRSEGKSTNAINLALTFAELGKRVILMDCDLRLPTVAAKLLIPEDVAKQGLTDVLVGAATMNDVVYRDKNREIWILPSGTIPPDPTKLLQSNRMAAVIGTLKNTFDYIILDCPPVTEVIDAALLAPYTDGYVLICKHNETHHRELSRMLMQLDQAGAKILGFLYANAPSEDKKYYKKGRYGHYGHYGHYGYYQKTDQASAESEKQG